MISSPLRAAMKRISSIVTWLGCMILVLTCFCQRSRPSPLANHTAATEQFRWLDSARDSQVWNRVLLGLHQELEPDDPEKVPPHYVATQYKYIYQIRVFSTAALVIIGNRETKESPGSDYFNAYSYDVRNGSKRAIVTETPTPRGTYPASDVLWQFKVIKLAHFDRLPASDVVFTYDGCSECEADHYIASFKYEPGRGWTTRRWEKAQSLYLESDPEPDDDVVSAYYLFKIKDWNDDGLDELVVRRREISRLGKRSQRIDDSTTMYEAENGILVGHLITDPKERETINAELCVDSDLLFCKRHKTSSSRHQANSTEASATHYPEVTR
jgi:hypothetical protein